MKRQRAEISSNVISHIKSAHPIEMWRSNKLGIKEKISRGNIPRLIFSCPVPSGLPHRSHCVPMNMNPSISGAVVRDGRLELPTSCSQTRRDTNFAIPGYLLFSMIPRRTVKIKFFLSVVIPVVKAAFTPFSAIEENPANAGVARLCGVSPYPVPDTATALPKQARYQLR